VRCEVAELRSNLSEIFAKPRVRLWEEWINLIVGVWLLLSPWILGFANVSAHLLNALIVGILIVLTADSALGEEKGGNQ
jgi:hypothetical protein